MGDTTARGYGTAHQHARKAWAPRVATGQEECRAKTCLHTTRLIHPGEPWDLGHTDDRRAYTGPEHADCNRSAGGRNGAIAANANRSQAQQRYSAEW